MWFNSKQREEPYQILTSFDNSRASFGDKVTGGAWLSSARVVRCWVKSATSATLACCHQLHSKLTAGDKPEEGGMTSNHHEATRATMDNTSSETARSSKSHKVVLSSDCESATRLHEAGIASIVIACYGEYVPGSCTHRPSHESL